MLKLERGLHKAERKHAAKHGGRSFGEDMRYQRSLRGREPETNSLPNLGKHLGVHQSIPAHHAKQVANAPRTDIGKAVLSATGGNPRVHAGATALQRGSRVIQQSHFDAKRVMRTGGVQASLKLTPHQKSLISV